MTFLVIFGVLCTVLIATSIHLFFSNNIRKSLVSCFLQSLLVGVLFLIRDTEYLGVIILLSGALLCVVAFAFALLIENEKTSDEMAQSKTKMVSSLLFSCILSGAISAAVYFAYTESPLSESAENNGSMGVLLSQKYIALFVPVAVLILIAILAIGFLLRKEKAKGVVFNAK